MCLIIKIIYFFPWREVRMNSRSSLPRDGSSRLEPLCLVWLLSAMRSAGITGRPPTRCSVSDKMCFPDQFFWSISTSCLNLIWNCLSWYRQCVSEVGGLSMAAAGQLRSPVSCSTEPDDSMEPYTTERLSRLPGGYTSLTEPFTAFNIDFNNVQVSKICVGCVCVCVLSI